MPLYESMKITLRRKKRLHAVNLEVQLDPSLQPFLHGAQGDVKVPF